MRHFAVIVVESLHKGSVSNVTAHTCLMAQAKEKEAAVKLSESYRVVSSDVIVMYLMLKCMKTSKEEIQAHNPSCLWRFVILVMFTFSGHVVAYFDKTLRFLFLRKKKKKIERFCRESNFENF